MGMTQRDWVVAAIALIGTLVAAGATHSLDEREADARVRAAEDAATLRLGAHQEASAERTIELEGQVAECQLARRHDACPNTGSLTFAAHVAALAGRTAAHVGDACRVDVTYTDDPLDSCRALVRCGDAWLYGGPGIGFFACSVNANGIVHGEDAAPTSDGGDPRLVIDRPTHTVIVSDEAPAWSVTLTLDET